MARPQPRDTRTQSAGRASLSRAAVALARAALCAALAAGGCGGTPRGDASETFARIQVEEARVEHADARASAAGDCGAREASCVELCDASYAIGELARTIDDRDARERAARAEARCVSCNATLAARCTASHGDAAP